LTIDRAARRSARLSSRRNNAHFQCGAVLKCEWFGVSSHSSGTSSSVGATWSAVTIFEGTQDAGWAINSAVLGFNKRRAVHTITKFCNSDSTLSDLETITATSVARTPWAKIRNLAVSIARS
jgi:hypothetical protein